MIKLHFFQATTAQLSWKVHNCDVMGSLGWKSGNGISRNFETFKPWAINFLWNESLNRPGNLVLCCRQVFFLHIFSRDLDYELKTLCEMGHWILTQAAKNEFSVLDHSVQYVVHICVFFSHWLRTCWDLGRRWWPGCCDMCKIGMWPGPWFSIKMSSYQYRKSHCGDKTILRLSYLHNGISFTGKTTSLHWIGALIIFFQSKQQNYLQESHWVNCPSLRDATGKFPDYPADDEGGSAAIFMEKDPAEIEAELRAKVGLQSLHLYFILYFLL